MFFASVPPTSTRVSIFFSQNILPLLQDLLQRRLEFTGQNAVLIAQLSHHKKGQQQSHDAVSNHAFNPSHCLIVNIYSSLNIKTSNVTRVFNFCCDKLNNYIWCFDHIVFSCTRFKTQDPVLNFKSTLYWEM